MVKIGNPFKPVTDAVKDVFDAGEKAVEKAGGVVANIGTGGAYNAAKKQKKLARREEARQRQAIAEQRERELSQRKHQIDQQRERLAGSGQGTKRNSQGVRANINKERLG